MRHFKPRENVQSTYWDHQKEKHEEIAVFWTIGEFTFISQLFASHVHTFAHLQYLAAPQNTKHTWL